MFFDEGNDAFMLTVRSPSGDLAVADAVTLADRQAERVTGQAADCRAADDSSSSRGYRIGEILGGLASAALLVWGLSYWNTPQWRAGAAVRRAADRARANGGDGAYPPPPHGAPDAGWLPNPLHMNEQLFWNGRGGPGAAAGCTEPVGSSRRPRTPTRASGRALDARTPTGPHSATTPQPDRAPLTCNRLAA